MAENNMAVSLVETVRRHAAGLLNLGDLPNCVGLPGEFINAIPNGARGKLFARTGGAFADLINRGEVDTEFVVGLFSVAQQNNLLQQCQLMLLPVFPTRQFLIGFGLTIGWYAKATRKTRFVSLLLS